MYCSVSVKYIQLPTPSWQILRNTVISWCSWSNWYHLPHTLSNSCGKLDCYVARRNIFFLKFMEDFSAFVVPRYPCFGPLVISALGFKVMTNPSLICFLTCVQWIPQINLWCNIYWPLDDHHGSWAFLIQYFSTCKHWLRPWIECAV